MDLHGTIRELRAQHARLVAAIAELEALAGSRDGAQPTHLRRGRKSMGEAERREVSERMKRYWANRKVRGDAGYCGKMEGKRGSPSGATMTRV